MPRRVRGSADGRTPYRPELPPSGGLARLVCGSMEGIVLRVRLISGDSMDVTYEERDASSEDEVIDHVVSTLAEASGMLRCRPARGAVLKRDCCGGSRAPRRGAVGVRTLANR